MKSWCWREILCTKFSSRTWTTKRHRKNCTRNRKQTNWSNNICSCLWRTEELEQLDDNAGTAGEAGALVYFLQLELLGNVFPLWKKEGYEKTHCKISDDEIRMQTCGKMHFARCNGFFLNSGYPQSCNRNSNGFKGLDCKDEEEWSGDSKEEELKSSFGKGWHRRSSIYENDGIKLNGKK